MLYNTQWYIILQTKMPTLQKLEGTHTLSPVFIARQHGPDPVTLTFDLSTLIPQYRIIIF